MKTKKFIIIAVAVIAAILLMLTGTVNAATTVASPAEAKAGETVTVTVSLESGATGVQFDIATPEGAEYVSASSEAGTAVVSDPENGVRTVVCLDVTAEDVIKNVVVTYKISDSAQAGDVDEFTVTKFEADTGEGLTSGTAKVTIVASETPVEPTTPSDTTTTEPATENPTTTEEPATTTTTGDAATTDTTTSAEKLPQTGATVFVGIIAAIAIVGVAAIVVMKRK